MPHYTVTVTVPQVILLTYSVRVRANDPQAARLAALSKVERHETDEPDETTGERDFALATAHIEQTDHSSEHRDELMSTVQEQYPQATRLDVTVQQDDNNPGMFMIGHWRAYNGQTLIGEADGMGVDDLDQALANYVDAAGIDSNFTVTFTPVRAAL